MSNTKTFLTLALLILLGSMGAAQAQVVRIGMEAAPPAAAREGGEKEASSDLFLSFTKPTDTPTLDLDGAVIELHYSVPIAAGTTAVRVDRDQHRVVGIMMQMQ